MAVSIGLLATTWILKKKYIPVIVTVLFAAQFHRTALLLIPIILIAQGKPWNAKTMLFIACMLIAVIFVDQFTDFLDEALVETQYTSVVSDWQAWGDDGTNPLRVLVYSLPAIFSLIGIKYIMEENDAVINLATNMSIITMGLYLISMFTSGIFIGRLPIYASLYSSGILLPWEMDHLFNKESAQILKLCLVIFYIALYVYQMHFAWGVF